MTEKETRENEVIIEMNGEENKREIVVPGEIVASGTSFLPGENTKREGEDIIATRFGLLDKEGRLVKIIPLSGIYLPRKGNIIIGKVEDITFNGWLMDINSPYKAFLPISECRGFISKREDLSTIFSIGDMVIAQVVAVKSKGVDLTTRDKGLHKIENGLIIKINSSKVPRVIGKQGSMINLIKQETGCNIVVGQNGIIWIKGDDVEQELLAKEAIKLITEKSFTEGLTDFIKNFLEKSKNKKK
ncbi:MAG: exosome complex RNA-binding protein Rrp4 [Candidatus Pacearchaeota archaeon]